MSEATDRIRRHAAFVALNRLTSHEVLADHETSQARGDRLLAEYRALREAGVSPEQVFLSADPAPAAADPVFAVIARHADIYQTVGAMEAAGVPDQDEFSD